MVVAGDPRRYRVAMFVEVYGQEKPAKPRRALGASAALLMCAGVLAAQMSRTRGGDPLGPRIQPDGWAASFRVPRRFAADEVGLREIGLPYIAHGQLRSGRLATLAVYRIDELPFDSAKAVCDSVIRSHLGFPGVWRRTRREMRPDRRLGSEPAVEIWDADAGGLVRAAVLSSGEAYAVWLGVDGPEVDSHTYRLFELTCASFEFPPTP